MAPALRLMTAKLTLRAVARARRSEGRFLEPELTPGCLLPNIREAPDSSRSRLFTPTPWRSKIDSAVWQA
jgi:hypothetical protein